MERVASPEQRATNGRRRFQFSLRTLLFGSAVAAVVCGLLVRLPLEAAAGVVIFAAPVAVMAALVVSLDNWPIVFLVGAVIGAVVGAITSEWTLGVQLHSSFRPSVFATECAALLGAGAGLVVSGYRRGIVAMIVAVVWYAGVFAAVVIYVFSHISH
jgi:hypothetical protein